MSNIAAIVLMIVLAVLVGMILGAEVMNTGWMKDCDGLGKVRTKSAIYECKKIK